MPPPIFRPHPPLFESTVLHQDLLIPVDHLDRLGLGDATRLLTFILLRTTTTTTSSSSSSSSSTYLGIPVPKVLPNLFPHDLAICRYYALMRKQRREGLLPPEEPLLQEFKFTVPCGETTNRKNQDVAKFSKSSPRNMDGIS